MFSIIAFLVCIIVIGTIVASVFIATKVFSFFRDAFNSFKLRRELNKNLYTPSAHSPSYTSNSHTSNSRSSYKDNDVVDDIAAGALAGLAVSAVSDLLSNDNDNDSIFSSDSSFGGDSSDSDFGGFSGGDSGGGGSDSDW